MNRKKRILINTDYPLLRTGLGKNGRNLSEYLYKTDKYEVFYYACGMVYDSIEYQRLPYVTHGTLPNNPAEMEQIKQKGEYWVRDAAYGGYNLSKILLEVKPDVFITSNDTWASETYLNNPYIKRFGPNFIPHKTYDSVPFLPNQISYFDQVSKVYVWADFAVKEANRIGKKNVEKLTGIIKPGSFRRLPPFRKAELRARLNIPQDAFIVVKCSRNQIRKQFKSVLEGYVKWKKIHQPKRPTYVLFHTNFTEPHGWDMFRFCDELGIDKKELLTTYVCKKCKEYTIAPFQGNDHQCPFCKAEKSFCNIDIQHGVDEEQLNEIYNIADCMVHGADAAGLEITCVEGLYAGLPLATNPYAALEMFTSQPFVHSIDCTFATQHGTQFKRAVLNPNSIASFLQSIYSKSPMDIEKIARQGREWAVKQFSPEVVCKQWESIIDGLDYIDWDKLQQEVENDKKKNPDAIIEDDENVVEWVKQLYSKILKMNVEINDSGLQHWLNQLKNGMSKQAIVDYFRRTATQENNKKEIKFEDLINQNPNEKVLVVLKESIGDIIMSLSVLPGIRNAYPNHSIYFATDRLHHELFDGNPNVDYVIDYLPFMEHELACVSRGNEKGLFDVYINLGVHTQRQLNYITNNNICI